MTNYLAFDIETAKITPQDSDVQQHRPLGIACWAVAWVGSETTILHKGEAEEQEFRIKTTEGCGKGFDGEILPQMTKSQCCLLVARLHRAVEQGFTLLAHNGVGFDFDILAEESGMHDTCADLALHSVDTCLLVHCLKGFPVGLEAIAKGMNLQGKTEGMNGSMAPQMWAEGKFNEVLEYVAQDVRATLQVALEIEKRKGLTWIAKSGRRNSLPIPKLLTAFEALQLPEPDTSWMSEPISRERFTSWMEAQREV